MEVSVPQLRSLLQNLSDPESVLNIHVISQNTPTHEVKVLLDELLDSLIQDDNTISEGSPEPASSFDRTTLKRALNLPTLDLNFADETAVTRHLSRCLNQLQQLACKAISKAFIKQIEPRKQTAHPYRGGELTKPDWWPLGVRHKEPDHLVKSERITLMLNMIQEHMSTSQILSAATECYLSLDKYRIAILYEICFIKDKLEINFKGILPVSDFPGWRKRKIQSPPIQGAREPLGLFNFPLSSPAPVMSTPQQDKRFADENNFALSPEFMSFLQTTTPIRYARKPLRAKDPNLPPQRNDTATARKLELLDSSFKTLSPANILSTSTSNPGHSLERSPHLLPPLKMMHLNTTQKTTSLFVPIRENED